MASKMTVAAATKIVVNLADQDHGLLGEPGRTDARGRKAIDGWLRGAGEAGDLDVVAAIDCLGETRAAEVYDARREELDAKDARRRAEPGTGW